MKYICELCGLIYDEDKGDPAHGIPAGTPFSQLPDNFECPGCYSERQAFSPVGHKQTMTPPVIPEDVIPSAPKSVSDR